MALVPRRVVLLLVLALLLLSTKFAPVQSVRRGKRGGRRKAGKKSSSGGEGDGSVQHRGLVNTRVAYSSVLAHNDKFCQNTDHKHFTSNTLAYVTPWNGRKTFQS